MGGPESQNGCGSGAQNALAEVIVIADCVLKSVIFSTAARCLPKQLSLAE
jgi:hypothetical protein